MSDRTPSGDVMRRATFRVSEVDCPSCAVTVTKHLERLDGVESVDASAATGTVSVEYRPDRTETRKLTEAIADAGYAVDDTKMSVTLSVPEMDCSSCASKIEHALDRTTGIEAFETRPATGRVTIELSDDTPVDRAIGAIGNAGYDANPVENRIEGEKRSHSQSIVRSRRAGATAVGAILVTIGAMLHFGLPAFDASVGVVAGRSYAISHLLFITSAAIAGAPILRNGYYSARNRSLDIHFLMSIGIVASVLAHHPFEGAMLAVLFSVAELLERFSMDRARRSLRELMDLSPETATLRRPDGTEETVPVETLAVGDRVVEKPGEKVPVDGVVTDGESAVDQSPITGESVPVDKTSGDDVFAGSIAKSGYLEVEATSNAADSTISRIVRIVEEADRNRTNREQFVDRFASVYTPIVVLLAVAVAALPPLLMGWSADTWFLRGLTLLVIACPCAFVISTPVSVVSGITSAAKNGVLIKGGRHLEAVGESDVLAIDKTGTLTTGQLTVTDVVPLEGHDEADVLQLASVIERRSEHPIGAAIVEAAESQGITGPNRDREWIGESCADCESDLPDDSRSDPKSDAVERENADLQPTGELSGTDSAESDLEIDTFEALPGEGVRATIDDTVYYVGKPDLFEGLADLDHVHLTTDGGTVSGIMEAVARESRDGCDRTGCLDVLSDVVPDLEADGKTVVLVGTETEPIGVIAVADRVRPEARWSIERLRDAGVRVVMLTGDNEGTARAIADQVGIEEYHAELLPEEKLDWIRRLERSGGDSKRSDADRETDSPPGTGLGTPIADENGSTTGNTGRETDEARTGETRRSASTVVMVGDGINDAPALATATVGVAMGAAGTDTAIETADVALMSDDLTRLPYLFHLSRTANGVIRQNIGSSLVVKAVLAAGAPFGVVTVIHAVVIGDMGMSLGVTGNAMRLSNVEPDTYPDDAIDREPPKSD